MKIIRAENVTEEMRSAFARLIPQLTKSSAPTHADLEALIGSSSALLIAYEEDVIIGAAVLAVFRTITGLHAHVEDVIVDAASRGRGVGAALVHAALEEARQLGLDGVSLTCNPHRVEANKLYEKLGFKKWETNVYWYDLKI